MHKPVQLFKALACVLSAMSPALLLASFSLSLSSRTSPRMTLECESQSESQNEPQSGRTGRAHVVFSKAVCRTCVGLEPGQAT